MDTAIYNIYKADTNFSSFLIIENRISPKQYARKIKDHNIRGPLFFFSIISKINFDFGINL